MENYRFTELVKKEKGFEFYQAFREEEDWIIGGKENTYWFIIMKDQSVKETYIGKLKDGAWVDHKTKAREKRKPYRKCLQEAQSNGLRKELTLCRMQIGL